MTFYKIFEHPETRRYRTQIVTKASVFVVFFTVIKIFCPLLVAYRSYGFWLKEATFTEEPNISFKYRAILVLGTSTKSYVWSTFPKLNNLQRSNFVLASAKTLETDADLNGRKEKLNFQLSVPLADTDNVQSVELLLFFDYQLYRYVYVVMEGLAYINGETVFSAGKLSVLGRLVFVQDQLLNYKGGNLLYQTSVVNENSEFLEDYDINTILASYSTRNITTRFENAYYRWDRQRAPGQPFVVNATVLYTIPTIRYKPGFWYIIKWAWVQYVAIFLIFEFVVYRIKCFVFQNQVVSTVVERPSPPEKAHRH